MAKLISLLLIAAMAVQIIRPLGLPGLKKRMDFWKIAPFALAMMVVVLMIRPS
ncbi:hypothetical protein [Martelella radicis]|uniref:Uncharacterized protein n=1 Tax=Martelella radicis TaxID=1397476 RepID=A0A7W6PBP5_9HYPH|nr:hypothetical protein [Martelella radicis]MBB4124687.1 hypothetical protein [Martelella radicis]